MIVALCMIGRAMFVLVTFIPMQFNGPEWDNSFRAAQRYIRRGT